MSQKPDKPEKPDEDINVNDVFKRFLFASRWLLAPIYAGMIVMLFLLLYKFFQEIWHIIPNINTLKEKEAIVSILSLIDMSLVANLILIVMFNGYESFVAKIEIKNVQKMDWMGKVGFSTLKVKLISSIIAIASVDLLKTFLNLQENYSDKELKWRLIIYVAFIFSGVALTWMDRIAKVDKNH